MTDQEKSLIPTMRDDVQHQLGRIVNSLVDYAELFASWIKREFCLV